jgi:hypothetical protein
LLSVTDTHDLHRAVAEIERELCSETGKFVLGDNSVEGKIALQLVEDYEERACKFCDEKFTSIMCWTSHMDTHGVIVCDFVDPKTKVPCLHTSFTERALRMHALDVHLKSKSIFTALREFK